MVSLGPDSVSYTPGLFQQPLPRSFRTRFVIEGDYKVPIATASITTGSVKLNSLWVPFRPGGSSAFPSFTFVGPATESTVQPTGKSNLMSSGLYSNGKVISSKFCLRWSGSNSGNNVTCVVVPSLNVSAPTTVYQARTYPFARQCSFSVSKPNTGCGRDGWFRYSVRQRDILGITPLEGKADWSFTTFTPSSDPDVTLWWNVWFQSNDQDVSGVTASTVQVRVEYVVELFSLISMSNV
jgi:hypothetical protein